jgi:hypothetical protein|tara:strand:- start:32 stop:340 length:309 start_codon:yes stop_codon:yes gene_type:complete
MDFLQPLHYIYAYNQEEGVMKKFELRISDDPIEFTAEDASAFLDVWKSQSKWAFPDDHSFIRTAALSACDWSGKPMRFDSIDHFTADMMEAGMLAEVGDAQG